MDRNRGGVGIKKLFVCAGLLLAAGFAAFGGPNPNLDWGQKVKQPEFDLLEAIDRGVKAAGAGVVFAAELEPSMGLLIYSLDIVQGNQMRNVVINAKTGEVVENILEEEDHSRTVATLKKIGVKEGIRSAVKAYPGTPIYGLLLARNGAPGVAVMVVDADGKVKTVIVDGTTGEASEMAVRMPAAANADAPYLGVQLADADGQGKKGCFIIEILPASPAEKAGLLPGDDVQGVNGLDVGSPDDLIRTIAVMKPGDAAALEIERGGKEKKIRATLARRSDPVSAQGGGSDVRRTMQEELAREFTDTFPEDKADLGPTGRNAYFILEPGYQMVFEGNTEGKKMVMALTVLDQTRVIDGVTCRAIEEREDKEGAALYANLNYYAISKKSGNIYYFGETLAKDGSIEWASGEKGARYGMWIPAVPTVGMRYQYENAPGVGMDRNEIVSVTKTIETPAGTFRNCLEWIETNPLEPGSEDRDWFAPGVGLIQQGEQGQFKLVKYGFVKNRK